MKKESLRNMLLIGIAFINMGILVLVFMPTLNQEIPFCYMIIGIMFTSMSLILSYLEGE